MKIRKILCPVDFSEASVRAMQYAAYLATNHGCKLYLIYVIEKLRHRHNDLATYCTRSQICNMLEDEIEKHLCSFLVNLNHTPQIHLEVRNGKASPEIVKLASEEAIDLIIMGNRGTTSITGKTGCVARDVSRFAGCPVMLVRSEASPAPELRSESGFKRALAEWWPLGNLQTEQPEFL